MKRLLFSLLLLTGCGFSPLYSQSNLYLKDTSVIVDPIANQYGDRMRHIIQDKLFTPTSNPLRNYRLIVSPPAFSAGDKTISSNEFASTIQITGTTSYRLNNLNTGKDIYSGSVIAVSSYAVVRDPYATTVAKNHIQEELSEQLAEQVALDIIAQLSGEEK